MPVYKMVEEMPASEIMEWQAYDMIDPIGDNRMDMNFAHVLTFLSYVLGGKKDATLTDFVLNWESSVFTPAELAGKRLKSNIKQDKDTVIRKIYEALGVKE